MLSDHSSRLRLVRNHTELFSQLRDKPLLCVDVAKRYLRWIYEHKANRDWLRAVGMYNAGFGTDRRSMNRRVAYLNKVRNASNAWNN